MAAPTKDDAQLMVQIARWSTDLGIEEAMPELFAEDFDPESVDLTNAAVRKVLMLGESIGTLTKHDLLSVELVTDWLWISGLWSRVGPAARRAREQMGEPRLYENFERLAGAAG
jgi:hypothetical protein